MLLFVLSGLFLLRLDTRRLFSLLFHVPPRSAPRHPHSSSKSARRCLFLFAQ
jgi:hypothetical protein